MNLDVLIVGAGPAGSIAALVLARAGVRVRLVDRTVFPRDKLCGDTINPGTVALLRALNIAERAVDGALPIDGMIVSGDGGAMIEGRYPAGVQGFSLVRRDFDARLLEAAVSAGAEFQSGVVARGPVCGSTSNLVTGVLLDDHSGHPRAQSARLTIAADGRRSVLAFSLGLARHPARPRRWAVGAYYEGVGGLSSLGEMHIRRDRYIGVAPIPGGITNVCLVGEFAERPGMLRHPAQVVDRMLAADWLLRDRFAGARLIAKPTVMGPLAVDAVGAGTRGLLLAGDAAGFIDPMTGDGLRFAIEGGMLAARAAVEFLEARLPDPHVQLASWRASAFAGKYRFNRSLRFLVSSPVALSVAEPAARLAPGLIDRVIARAGDVRHAYSAA